MRGDVLDVGEVFQPAFDLEGTDAGSGEGEQVVRLVVVLHREQVLVLGDGFALVVDQRVGQAAGLRTLTAIGAAPGVSMADEALSGISDTERTMDEILQ